MTKQTDDNYHSELPRLGLDMGVYAVKGVLLDRDKTTRFSVPTAGDPAGAAARCLELLLAGREEQNVRFGLCGHNAKLIAGLFGISPLLEIEALQAGLAFLNIKAKTVISLGHENMYYLELDPEGKVTYFNRNGQCAAGSGAFWHQQAARMGYNDREMAELAVQAGSAVKISGRCAVFAKSDMTHAINEGASQAAVANGMARALVDLVVTGVAQNRIKGPGILLAVGGVAENKAVIRHLREYCLERLSELIVPSGHEYINALGAAQKGGEITLAALSLDKLLADVYIPDHPLPPLEPGKVIYARQDERQSSFDLSTIYLGVDCGSVSTKCAILDGSGVFIGGIYLPTSGRPALQVLELMKKVDQQYGQLVNGTRIQACTTGSGRFLAQKILGAEYAVDEITCQAEGVKSLFGDETLSIIEIGGEDSKFVQIKDGVLSDYSMNPVCAAGTGTFLENLAELLHVKIKEEFSQKAFLADYAIDLGDTCTLLSQSTLVAAASRGLPLESQLASLAYSSARNYLNKTVENRPLEGKLIFTGATAMNHALAGAFAADCGKDVYVPPRPELTGAIGAALVARSFHLDGEAVENTFNGLNRLNEYTLTKRDCRAACEHEHNCVLDVIKFADGSKFIYGDRCSRYSGIEKKKTAGDLPDYLRFREDKFWECAGQPHSGGTRKVGIASGGLFYELYPFWAAFFRGLGVQLVLSGDSSEAILEQGKKDLSAEMCYPVEVLIGHYRELAKQNLDFIFIPEVVSLEPLPWAMRWPRTLSCPLLQMIRGVVVHSLNLSPEQVLYAQLNYRDGRTRVAGQLLPVAKRLLGSRFSRNRFKQAVDSGYQAQERFQREIEDEGRRIFEGLTANPDRVVALILGRSYTLYDSFVSKGLLYHAGKRGLTALPQDYLLEYLRGWFEGRIKSPFLDGRHDDFTRYMDQNIDQMDNIYPAQSQSILSAALAARYLNENVKNSGLPHFNLVFQDPFKCGPNSMLRHYMGNVGGYLRLTLDEHTAAAGMITRLEAFKNTCRSRKKSSAAAFHSAKTRSAGDPGWKKILIPDATRLTPVLAAVFESYGVEAAPLPRGGDRNMALARRYLNGEECLPFIQNMQDFLEYADQNGEGFGSNGTVFFQGYACGPCRYGLYAQTQSLIINRAGHGPEKICALKTADLIKRFGLEFMVAAFDGTVAIDLLYKMLHATRPYEQEKGAAEALFEAYCAELCQIMRTHRFKWHRLITGSHLEPVEELLSRAAKQFGAIRRNGKRRPRILLGGEFYVRLDDRGNLGIIDQIEEAGGEVCLAPASELFLYTVHADYREARRLFACKKSLPHLFLLLGKDYTHRLALRDEHRLARAAAELLHDLEEPTPREIMDLSRPYVSDHYAGEPPMTIGRTIAFAGRDKVAGAIFVAPFNCLPASIVEAQQNQLSAQLGFPITTIYYDGRENANREEQIQSLVFQAGQNTEHEEKR